MLIFAWDEDHVMHSLAQFNQHCLGFSHMMPFPTLFRNNVEKYLEPGTDMSLSEKLSDVSVLTDRISKQCTLECERLSSQNGQRITLSQTGPE